MSENPQGSGTSSPIFQAIEQMQGSLPWGSFLDAGTGRKSIEWITALDTERWTAITASQNMARTVQEAAGDRRRPQDRVLVGNWHSEHLLYGERFDTVLLDYFIGAIEGFSPYWQEQALHRIRPHVGQRLYIIGVEPYVPSEPDTEAGRLVREIGRVRDACLLLSGSMPYREYPSPWVLRQLGQAGFRVMETRYFPIRYRERFVNGQLDLALRQLDHFTDPDTAESMRGYIEQLRARALPIARQKEGLKYGADYLISAEPMADRHRSFEDPLQRFYGQAGEQDGEQA
ncbi:class I SAM-dependent methyltransferase [Thioalkalivibrio sp. ALE11]|uniref:class I SAM-dependent methyltransferase n=1 Tax=Thioalkalivibrio sp. ALE11 TaxID=1265494 RepID=UPI000370AEAC|nr:class I SAM-dependent methyltransferase [Thioalkalivibrio sp. ALE11]